MESKAFTTIVIVLVCIFMFPIVLGLIGGVFGILGSIIGGLFGLFGGLLGAVFGAIGAVFGAIFGFLDWLIVDRFFDWDWPGYLFRPSGFTVFLLIIAIVLLARSRR